MDIVGDAQEEVDEEVMVRVFPVSPDITLGGVKKNLTITIRNDDGEFMRYIVVEPCCILVLAL